MSNRIHFPRESYEPWEYLYSKRIVSISGEIDGNTKDDVMGRFYQLHAMDNEAPIQLYVSSTGGEIYEGMAIINTIRSIPNPVIAIGSGPVMSMAVVIFAACDKRYCLPYTHFMMHQGQAGLTGDTEQIKREAKHMDKLEKEGNEIIAAACGVTVRKILRDTQKEFYLDAQEALKYGLVQKILPFTKTYETAPKSGRTKKPKKIGKRLLKKKVK